MSLLAGKQKTMEPLFGVAAPRSDGTGPPPALGSGTPDKAPELGMDPDLEPDEPDESVANSSSTAEQATSAAVPSGHSTKLSFGSNLELDLNSILSAAEAEDNAAAGGSGKAKSTPSTRVSPRAADLALGGGFSLDDALADAHPFDAAIGSDGGGGGGGGGFAHPFDRGGGGMSHASAKDAAKRRRVRRSMHRPSVSFSDQPGSLEGAATGSLAAQLRELATENSNAGKKPKSLVESMLTGLAAGQRRSNSMTSLDLIDLLEGGEARECLSDDVVGTPKISDDGDESGGWEHCVFETDPEKSQFRMFTYESNKFLLSARRSGDDFYISQYFDFPEEYEHQDGEMADRFCAVVRKTTHSYRIWNRGCEICDNELAKYRCSMEDDPSQRQELATVRHVESKVMDRHRVIADARQIMIDIPTLDSESLRQGWCARFPRTAKTSLELASILPDWNPRIQSLSMKFLHGKVKAASSKNFLVSQVSSMDEEHACFQFGKTKSGLFNLSYRNPVAAIQAFGVALSLYHWLGASAKEKRNGTKK